MSLDAFLASELADFGLIHEVTGCSDAELAAIMEAQAVSTLPSSYTTFLKVVGCDDAGLFETGDGTQYLFPGLLTFREVAERITRRTHPDLTFSDVAGPDAFVFGQYLDEQALLFRVTDGDDPPVFRIHEARDSLERVSPAFSSFIRDILANRYQSGGRFP